MALDQARMPSLVPTTVGLSPLVSAALAGTAAGAAVAAGGTPTGPAGDAAAAAAGTVEGTPVETVQGGGDTPMTGAAGGEDEGMDVGDDALGAAGGAPGDLTAAGGDGEDADEPLAKRPVPRELAPSGAPDEPLRTPGEGLA